MLVSDIYNPNIFPIQDTLTVKEALEFLITKQFNGVLVLDKKNHLVGVLSLQDIAASIVPPEMVENINLAQALYKPEFFKERCQEIKNIKVKDIMRTTYKTVGLDTNLMEVAADYLNNNLYIIPVIEGDKVIGIVARSEIKKALASGMNLKI